ncbi:hypothetical protein Zmor_025574 [Zophobas morio]|uniref:Tetraspanin n=1 Tax=Zophobas morio TaxID=2755281 RepID=A0AA38HTH3_9CUCU|nr:hypothetical protein Zmor_025574 [Zophobas morio]
MCFIKETIKFAVLAFGIIFLLTGVALVSIGAIYEITFKELSIVIPKSYDQLFFIPHLTVAAGVLITLSTCFGCGGALSNNRYLLFTYAVLLICVFFLQLSIGIFTFLVVHDKEDLSKSVNTTTTEVFQAQNDPRFIDLLQAELHCCGTYGPTFWNETKNLPFPPSCCTSDDCRDVHSQGCQTAVFVFLTEAARVVGIAVLAFSVAEVAGAILTLYMGNLVKHRSRKKYTEVMFEEE